MQCTGHASFVQMQGFLGSFSVRVQALGLHRQTGPWIDYGSAMCTVKAAVLDRLAYTRHL